MSIFTLLLTTKNGNSLKEWTFTDKIADNLTLGQEIAQAMTDYDTGKPKPIFEVGDIIQLIEVDKTDERIGLKIGSVGEVLESSFVPFCRFEGTKWAVRERDIRLALD